APRSALFPYTTLFRSTLRCHHNQWPLESGCNLPAQQMKILRRSCRIANAQIVFGTELQITLEPCAGMFGALAFIAVRQQHRQTRSEEHTSELQSPCNL